MDTYNRPNVPFLTPAPSNADKRQAASIEADFSTQLNANLAIEIARNSTALDRLIALTERLETRKPVPIQRFYYLTVGGASTAVDMLALPRGESWFVEQILVVAFAGATGNPVVTITGLWPDPVPIQATPNIPYSLLCRVDAEALAQLTLSVAGGAGTVMVMVRWARAE